jgi:nucleoside-diphosphate-sugar epimerase
MFAIITPSTEPPLTSYRGQLMTRDVHFDIAFARKELGYHPKIPWQEGIRRTVEAIQ